ncbi:MAG: metal ABC transporter ATP-binding protein [Ardenticatenales bacterium]|nr:metal ABC transporter ATP-binding protein [Ardenticatenales bacterium]
MNPSDKADILLHTSGLSVRYGRVTALDAISFDLLRGERVAVLGPNGAGKSTLFKVIAGLILPTAGDLRFMGAQGSPTIAYVPQRSGVDWSFPVTVFDVVMMGRTAQIGLFRRPKARDREMVQQSLAFVALTELAGRQISELSGGQQQRMFIARALAQEAQLMLMDEPLAGLDVPSQQGIYEILDMLRERQVTVLVATHDLDQAAEHFDRVMLLNRSLLGFDRPERVFTPARLADAYGSRIRLVETAEGMLVLTEKNQGGL